MGCIPNQISHSPHSKSNYSPQKNYQIHIKKNKKNFEIISYINILNIVDYLNFKDLYELGKTNRKFNIMVKQHKILVKFFKKKETNSNMLTNKTNSCISNIEKIQSFSLLREINYEDSLSN